MHRVFFSVVYEGYLSQVFNSFEKIALHPTQYIYLSSDICYRYVKRQLCGVKSCTITDNN